MNFLELIGLLTILVIFLKVFHGFYRMRYPKKYTWVNCPNDHDTMARCGSTYCDKCKSEL